MSWRDAEVSKRRVPTWVVTLVMVASLGVAVWAVARDEIADFISQWV